MIKRTIFITSPAILKLKNGQLRIVISETEEEKSLPVEDLGFVVIENLQVQISMPLISALNANNVAIIFCDESHMPKCMLLNLDSNRIQTELFAAQINAGQILKKRLWQQIVKRKIENQAAHLNKAGKESMELTKMVNKVQSGDVTNREGLAARLYWQHLMGNGFVRDRSGLPPNFVFNYIYIILRAAVARSLVGSGLLPTLGIHHHNRYNSFCLADDIMEPYRPFADQIAVEVFKENPLLTELNTKDKIKLLSLLQIDVKIAKNTRPLMIALSETTASLARCFKNEGDKIELPVFY